MKTKLLMQQMFADSNIYINIISLINWDALASDRITFNFILVHSVLMFLQVNCAALKSL